MAYGVKEAVRVSAVRVLKKSSQSAMPQYDHGGAVKSHSCQFVFVVSSRITTLTPLVGRGEYHELSFSTTEIRYLGFDPIALLSPRKLALSKVLQTDLFIGQNYKLLAWEISKILLTCFQFTAATLSGETPIKVVVHIERKRDVTYMPEDSDQPAINPVCTSFAEEEEETRYDSEQDEFMDDEEEETRYDSEQDEFMDDEEEETQSVSRQDEFVDDEPKEEYSECCAFERVKADLDDHEISQKFGKEEWCAICLDGLFKNDKKKVVKTRCGHIFHESCLDGWLPKCATCPMCRSTCIAVV